MPEPVDRPDGGQWVEPVVDAAAPEHDLVGGIDTGDDATHRRYAVPRRFVLDAERDDRDQRCQPRIGVVRALVDPTSRREMTEPEVALPWARAQEEVAAPDLLVDDVDRRPDRPPPGRGIEVARRFEDLEMKRVVQVDHERGVDVTQSRSAPERVALHDDDVGAPPRAARARPVRRARLRRRRRTRSLRFVVTRSTVCSDRERARHVHGSDGRPGHPRTQYLAGDDDDAA